MGKIVALQSIVVATAATRWHNHEGEILRYVLPHSIGLTALVSLLVLIQIYAPALY
jgi:lactate permease